MMWPYNYVGWNWLWMVGMMMVVWVAIIGLAVWFISTMARDGENEAMAILRKRLVAGEISQDEYEKTRRLLQG